MDKGKREKSGYRKYARWLLTKTQESENRSSNLSSSLGNILGKPLNDPELIISHIKLFLPLMTLTSRWCGGYEIVFVNVYYCKWVAAKRLHYLGIVFMQLHIDFSSQAISAEELLCC